MVKIVTVRQKLYLLIKSLKSKKKEADTNFVLLSVEKCGWAIQKSFVCIDPPKFYILSHPREFKNV